MYPIFILSALGATLAGTHTENFKAKICAATVLCVVAILTVWYSISTIII